ncbi:hypothetical protein D3C73_1213730 [compost metagenome]
MTLSSGSSAAIKYSIHCLLTIKYSSSASSQGSPSVKAEMAPSMAKALGSATSSVLIPRFTSARSSGLGTIIDDVWSPARLNVLVGATHVMLFRAISSDTEAKGV